MLKHRILSRYAFHAWIDVHICFPILKLAYQLGERSMIISEKCSKSRLTLNSPCRIGELRKVDFTWNMFSKYKTSSSFCSTLGEKTFLGNRIALRLWRAHEQCLWLRIRTGGFRTQDCFCGVGHPFHVLKVIMQPLLIQPTMVWMNFWWNNHWSSVSREIHKPLSSRY